LDAKKITVDPLKKIQLDECILISHEIIEFAGKKVKKVKGNNKRSLLYVCPNCSFRIHFLGSGDGDLALCDLQYCHVIGCQSKPIIGTNYNWRQLASALAPFVYAKTSAGQDLSSLDMKHVLRGIVAGPIFALQKNTLARAKDHAIELAVGIKKKEEVLMMNALVQCLQNKGHKVACLYTSVKEQKEVVHKNAKSDFDRSNRLKKKENREKFIFNEKMAYAPLAGLDENRPILYGYVYSPRYIQAMLPAVKKIFCADGAHMKGVLKGTILSLWGYDANEHLLCIGICFVYANEDEKRWKDFLTVMKGWFPVLEATAILTDGDKGLAPALKHVFPRISHLLCYRHVADNVRKACGGGNYYMFFFLIIFIDVDV
jgi:hypothetical protein